MRVQDLQGLAWHAFMRKGKTIEAFVAETGLHFKTVENFVWGETKRPSQNTVDRMTEALDFRYALVPLSAPRQPDEKDVSWAREILRREALGKRKK
jgi:hypothetical protein